MERVCKFTGKPLDKYNTFYNPDGTYMDINTRQFLDSIPDLPLESLELLVKLSTEARNNNLSNWQKFLHKIRIKR